MPENTFVTGGAGSGKTLYGVWRVLRELEFGSRGIVTNLPFNVGDVELPERLMHLADWCAKYAADVDLRRRLRMLSRAECYEFPRFIVEGDLPLVPWQQGRRGTKGLDGGGLMVPDLDLRMNLQSQAEISPGVLYVIDEVHLFFGAREWQNTGPGIQYYMSQFRHLNDDIVLLSQHPGKVDKNFRRDATEWVVPRNMEKSPLFMGVTLKGEFRYYSYPFEPLPTDKPSVPVLKLNLMDKEMCRVYDTMQGVGLTARLAPEQRSRVGRHWIVWVLLLLFIGVVCAMVPRVIHGVSRGATLALIHGASGGVRSALQRLPPLPDVQRSAVAAPVLQSVVPQPVVESSEGVYLAGLAVQGGQVTVMLSDGRTFRPGDRRVEIVTEELVVISGVVYRPRPDVGVESPTEPGVHGRR